MFASCNPVLEIYRNCGMVLKKDDARVKKYLEDVANAEFELASVGEVSVDCIEKLNKDMIPLREYVKMIGM